MRKALVIGIDNYPGQALHCCVNDARDVARLLKTNENNSPNFDVDLMTSPGHDLSNWKLEQAVSNFFKSSTRVETAVLYFAGHGFINPLTDSGYIVGTDGRQGAWGMSLSHLLDLANRAYSTITSSVIILDCCHAGHLGELMRESAGSASVIGKGVTILTSCNADEKAKERGRHGLFTELLIDALDGGSADVRGNITPASVYSLIDQALRANDQRPLYKANVQQSVTLRRVKAGVSDEVLRKLPVYFPDPDEDFRLDPSYEPNRDNVPRKIKKIPPVAENVAVFEELQACNRQGLVVPVGEKHMYYAAINKKACQLTAAGKRYRRLAEKGMI